MVSTPGALTAVTKGSSLVGGLSGPQVTAAPVAYFLCWMHSCLNLCASSSLLCTLQLETALAS